MMENKLSLSPNDQQNRPSHIDDEKQILTELLIEHDYNLTAVAKSLNIARSTLYRKLKKYQLNQLQKTVPLIK